MLSGGRMLLLASFAVTLGCGGTILGSDGGTSHPPPVTGDGGSQGDGGGQPPPGTCLPMQAASSASSDGTCSVADDWSCGEMSYHIECTCQPEVPNSGMCLCSHYTADGTGSLVYVPYVSPVTGSGCPSCTSAASVVAVNCGFPTQ